MRLRGSTSERTARTILFTNVEKNMQKLGNAKISRFVFRVAVWRHFASLHFAFVRCRIFPVSGADVFGGGTRKFRVSRFVSQKWPNGRTRNAKRMALLTKVGPQLLMNGANVRLMEMWPLLYSLAGLSAYFCILGSSPWAPGFY